MLGDECARAEGGLARDRSGAPAGVQSYFSREYSFRPVSWCGKVNRVPTNPFHGRDFGRPRLSAIAAGRPFLWATQRREKRHHGRSDHARARPTRTMDPSMLTPEMMAFAQKQMANMTPEQLVRARLRLEIRARLREFLLPRPPRSRQGRRGEFRRATRPLRPRPLLVV